MSNDDPDQRKSGEQVNERLNRKQRGEGDHLLAHGATRPLWAEAAKVEGTRYSANVLLAAVGT